MIRTYIHTYQDVARGLRHNPGYCELPVVTDTRSRFAIPFVGIFTGLANDSLTSD